MKGQPIKAVIIPVSSAGDVNIHAMEPMEFDNRNQMQWFQQGLITACNMIDGDCDWVFGLYTTLDEFPNDESRQFAEQEGFI